MPQVNDAVKGFKAAFTDSVSRGHVSSGNWFAGLGRHTLEARGFGNRVVGLGADALMFVPRLVGGAIGLAGHGVGAVSQGTFEASLATGKAAGRGALHVAKQPVVGVIKLATGAVRVVRGHPIITGVVAAGAGILGINSYVQSHAEARTQQELVAQVYAPMQPQQSYYNSVSPQETAAMNARLKQGDNAINFAEATRATPAPAENGPVAAL